MTLAMLIIIIIISQELGHTSFKKNAQLENELGIDEVTINSLRRVGSAEMSKPTKL